jgi:phosphatidylglycerophosphate synthase
MPPTPAPPARKPGWPDLLAQVHGGGGLWITRFYHYAGIAIAWLASRAGLTPNALTLGSAALTTAGCAILIAAAPGVGWGAAMASFCLMALGYAADCADGQLARATGSGSPLGAWLDHTLDAWKIVVTNASLGWVGVSRAAEAGDPLWPAFLAPNLSVAGTALYFFGWNYKVSLVGKGHVGKAVGQGVLRRLLELPLHLTDFGLFLMLWLVLPFPDAFLLCYLTLAAVTFPVFLAYLALSAWALRKM